MWLDRVPRWVVVSMNSVYAAVNRVAVPVSRIVGGDQLNSAIIMLSSAIKFVVGGRAMFVRLASNHQVAINGRRGCNP